MAKEPRVTRETLKVLDTILQNGEMAGVSIAKETRLATGTLYPILMRLERVGWLRSRWEEEAPQALGRPRRRFYQVTPLGVARVRSEGRALQPMIGRLACP